MATEPRAKINHSGGGFRPLIDNLTINHGPVELLGRFFLEADAVSRSAGVTPAIGTFEELFRINSENADSWLPIIPLFDPKNAPLLPENAFCLIGYNQDGEAVAGHAMRLYSWPDTTFKEEAESLRLFYADPEKMRLPGETCIVSSQLARNVTGRVVYSGAAWVRPDYRGLGLAQVYPRLAKAYAYSLWRPDYIVSWMTESTYAKGLLEHVGYTSADWSVELKNSTAIDLRFAFLTMRESCLLDHVRSFSRTTLDAKINSVVRQRRTQQP